MTGPLAEVLDGQHQADLQRAARALLKEPLLTPDGPYSDAFRLVRRHTAELREWFERNAGWSLRTDPDAARLRKTPGTLTDATHPAREATRTALPFTRRRYVLLCLTLAALERGESQVALGRLAEQVVLAAADPELLSAGVMFTLERRDERLDLAAVVRVLLRLGVLRRVAGDHYDVEEFWFRDGRLLLRGNNGTGKSKVLALTLPFLLDGDLSARRVEPDGDPGKRMEWNLLLGGEHPHPERLGYTWIEFGRLDEATGEPHFRTLLCGLKAVAGRGIARHWFAVTDQRIGVGLDLLDATGTALSRDRLAEAIGGRGMVYDTAKTYRRAVDEALFGLGERRYGALVDLLIQLRQPQLSKRPSEAALSRALTEALSPMDQAVVADAAEAFRSLDEEKEELRAAREAEQASSAFLDHYRRYARLASRRRARLPRREHARYENLQRELAKAQADRDQALTDREEARARAAALGERAARLAAQDAALRSGPEMRDAQALDRAAADASRTAGELTRAEADRRTAAEAHTRALGRLATAGNRLTAAQEALDDIQDRVTQSAAAARLDVPRTEGAPEAVLRREADEATSARRRALDHVTELATRTERAEEQRRAARRRADEADEEVVHSGERLAEAEEKAAGEGRALVTAVREHLAGCVELRVDGLPGVLDAVQDWVSSLDGPLPARTAADEAHRTAASRLADQAAGLAHREAARTERQRLAAQELTALEAGGERGPSAPYTRTPDVRDRALGAPLWRLVDFRPHVTDAERAGLEAALEASGLLDAWVRPDGSAVAADGHDVLLAPVGLPSGAGLDRALCPAVDPADVRAAAVGEETVARLLASIGLAAESGDRPLGEPSGEADGHDTWVCADGRFRSARSPEAGPRTVPSTWEKERGNRHAAPGSGNCTPRLTP